MPCHEVYAAAMGREIDEEQQHTHKKKRHPLSLQKCHPLLQYSISCSSFFVKTNQFICGHKGQVMVLA